MNSYLQDEIFAQPAIIQNQLHTTMNIAEQIGNSIRNHFKYIVIAARGSSDNAARYAQYLFGAHNRIQVALATPSLFTMYHTPPSLDEALVIGISQSGQSPDIVAVLETARKQGRPTIAITNIPESPLAKTADYILPLEAGLEKAIAATKTYTASMAALALLSCEFSNDPQVRNQLMMVPDQMQTTLELCNTLLTRVERYRYINHCTVIGRGFNYATAFEIALKIKELTQVIAESYSPADFRHGPIATIRPGFPVILIAPLGAVHHDIIDLIQYLSEQRAEIIVISNAPEALHKAHLAFPIAPDVPDWTSPFSTVIAGQLFSYQLTIEKGYNPDQPIGLTKVTETY